MKKTLILVILALVASLAARDLSLDIMFTNDVHGGIDRYEATFMNPEFPPIIGGGASAATYIKRVRAYSDGTTRDNLLLDAGDFFQGHPVGSKTKGRAIIEFYNAIGYEALTIGNHEYDIGEDSLKATLALANFPILSCNIIDRRTGELVDYARPYVFFNKLGLKIAVIGVTTTDTAQMSFEEHIKNVEFVSAKESLEKYIPIVKQQGADLVVVLGHMGLPYDPWPAYEARYGKGAKPRGPRRWGYDAQELAHEVEGIDLLIGGHIHKGIKEPWSDPVTHTLVVQGYAYGSNVCHLTLTIDQVTKTISGYKLPTLDNGQLVTMFEAEFIPDPEIGPMIAKRTAQAEKGMDDIVGTAAVYLSKAGSGPQSLVGNMVCDAMKRGVECDFAFINLGGVRGEIANGPVTYRDIFNVMPFDNEIVVMNVDGLMLKKIVEARVEGSRHGLRVDDGMKIVVNRKRPDYDRVVDLTVAGQPWEADHIYRVATSDFILAGNAGLTLLKKIPEDKIERTGVILRQALVDYFANYSPVTAHIDDRWVEDEGAKMSDNILHQLKDVTK